MKDIDNDTPSPENSESTRGSASRSDIREGSPALFTRANVSMKVESEIPFRVADLTNLPSNLSRTRTWPHGEVYPQQMP